MNILHAIILGIVQGVSEFLPISSTGHLILAEWFLKMGQGEFLKSFDIIIQLGSILAVVVLYWRELFVKWEIIKRLAIAFLPTGILGLLFYKMVKQYLLGNEAVVLWSLLLGGLALILFEFWHKDKSPLTPPRIKCGAGSKGGEQEREIESISYKNAFIVGLFQSIAMIPGVSRSAATIIGGLSLGLKRKTIVEFSFILAVPTMIAATGLDLFKNWQSFSANQWDFLAVGFLAAFLVALASIKFLLSFIKRYNFVPFGVYRIGLAIVFWWMMFA